jgi:endoglucanase
MLAAMTRGRVIAALAAATGSFAAVGIGVASGQPGGHSPTGPRAAAALEQQCPDHHSAHRDPANPLDLPVAPGPNPLTGARFYVPGPARGAAAGAIASLLRIRMASLRESESWATFRRRIEPRLRRNRNLRYKVIQLSKIASQPEVQRISAYSRGGGPNAVFLQTQKIICKNIRADPGAIPIINTYFLHPGVKSHCASPAQVRAAAPVFTRRVNEFVAAISRRPVVLLLETDALGSSSCYARRGSLGEYVALLDYEVQTVATLPHALVYVEAGYSDSNSAAYTARALNAASIGKIRGFYTNDTHLNWTINEVRWATQVSALTGGAHFIVNTAQNGRGPLLNRRPRIHGIQNLCNPPRRGLGPRPTTATGFALADAWLWTSPPGNSSGCGGGPPGGVFYTARAIGLASRANGKLGPGYPSRPY